MPGAPPLKLSRTAECLASCVGSGVPTSGIACSNMTSENFKKTLAIFIQSVFRLAAMGACSDTQWLEELFGFSLDDRVRWHAAPSDAPNGDGSWDDNLTCSTRLILDCI